MRIVKLLFHSFLYIADNRIDYYDKLIMYLKMLTALAPIAYVLEIAGFWFIDNKKFVTFFILIVIINSIIGIWKHKKMNEFSFEEFFQKTSVMLIVVIVTYFLLGMIASISGKNFISDGFEVSIQVMTLMYPTSKGLKSIFIISNGEYPPRWLMERVYNFNKEGSVTELFKTPKKEYNDEE